MNANHDFLKLEINSDKSTNETDRSKKSQTSSNRRSQTYGSSQPPKTKSKYLKTRLKAKS